MRPPNRRARRSRVPAAEEGLSNANLKTIEEILKLENNPAAKLTPQQAEVKTEWDKWRADTATFVKNMTAARAAVTAATGPAEASLTQPGQPKFDMNAFEGDMVSKDVAIKAEVKAPEGQTSEKDLVVTLSRWWARRAARPAKESGLSRRLRDCRGQGSGIRDQEPELRPARAWRTSRAVSSGPLS